MKKKTNTVKQSPTIRRVTTKASATGKKKNIKSLRASESAIWVNCPGSTHIKTGKYPFDDNDNGTFGNAVHSAAASILKDEPVKLTNQEELWKNERPEDFENYLNFYLEAIKNFSLASKHPLDQIETIIEDYFETKLKTHKYTGHCDFAQYAIVNQVNKTIRIHLQIIDLKTGFIPVSVYDNLQLFVYAHLIIYDIIRRYKLQSFVKAGTLQTEIESIIVQPAHNVIKFSEIGFDPERFENLYDPNDKTLKTGSWCKYCNKADICPEMKKVFQEYYKPEYQGVTIDRIELIREVLPMASVVQKVAERFQKDAKAILLDGGLIPGYKMGEKGGKRQWNASLGVNDIAKALGKKKNEITESVLMTPAQVEKLDKKIDTSSLTWQPMNDILVEDNNAGFESREDI